MTDRGANFVSFFLEKEWHPPADMNPAPQCRGKQNWQYHLDVPRFIVQVIFLRSIAEVLKKL